MSTLTTPGPPETAAADPPAVRVGRLGGPRAFLTSSPAAALGTVLVLAFIALALASLLLKGATYEQTLADRLRPPAWGADGSWAHALGTDSLGRDVLARVVTAVRMSLTIGVVAVAIAGVAGVTLGMTAGYFGGWLDEVVMRLSDAVLAIPLVLFALSVLAIRGSGMANVILVIAFSLWMTYARTARAETLVVRELPFITAARSVGCGHVEILRRHVLPQLIPSALVLATLNVSTAVLLEAGLSFLGVGIQPPDPSLGSLLAEGRQYIVRAPWLAIYPGLALFLLLLGVNLLGDGLRSFLDPTNRRRT